MPFLSPKNSTVYKKQVTVDTKLEWIWKEAVVGCLNLEFLAQKQTTMTE